MQCRQLDVSSTPMGHNSVNNLQLFQPPSDFRLLSCQGHIHSRDQLNGGQLHVSRVTPPLVNKKKLHVTTKPHRLFSSTRCSTHHTQRLCQYDIDVAAARAVATPLPEGADRSHRCGIKWACSANCILAMAVATSLANKTYAPAAGPSLNSPLAHTVVRTIAQTQGNRGCIPFRHLAFCSHNGSTAVISAASWEPPNRT
jgi:hypothetical protein